ncbi:hypothetical protein E2320_015003 [Naja naja]|nr:hypothetical protein E2320_015003 [Naja naja]
MQVKYANCGDYQFCYSYRGRPSHRPSVLMLHGFSADKDMWLFVIKFLPKNLHLICVDMPGHEGTTRSSLDDYSTYGQMKRIHQFVECINLNRKPFHLIGISMGGNVAGVYAAQYPADVCCLTLLIIEKIYCFVILAHNASSPLITGLFNAKQSLFVQQTKELIKKECYDEIPLIPSTPEGMADMLKLCSYVRFKVPHQPFAVIMLIELMQEKIRTDLQGNMDKIKAATQIIWGKQDQVLDVSGADILAKSIPGAQVHILENCGHSIVLERPRKTAKLILDFGTAVQDAENNKKVA